MGKAGVGMPATLKLEQFGELLCDAFGVIPYQVGSSLETTAWRDVDVRVMLDDDVYEAMGLGDPRYTHHNPKWVAYALAFSALGREMTGLPIDFQLQQTSRANEEFGGRCGRSSLGQTRWIMRMCNREHAPVADEPVTSTSSVDVPHPETP